MQRSYKKIPKREGKAMPEIKRVYSKDLTFDTDLFKLQVANMLKNAGYDDEKPILQSLEHCHFFRTFDSSGKPQIKCNSVAGHHHEVKISVDKEGNLKAQVSEAIGTKWLNDMI